MALCNHLKRSQKNSFTRWSVPVQKAPCIGNNITQPNCCIHTGGPCGKETFMQCYDELTKTMYSHIRGRTVNINCESNTSHTKPSAIQQYCVDSAEPTKFPLSSKNLFVQHPMDTEISPLFQ